MLVDMKNLLIIVIILQFSSPVFAGRTLRNADLNKYKDSSDSKHTILIKKNNKENDKKEETKKEKKDINKWCKKWIEYQNDLKQAKKDRDYAKSELERVHLSNTYADQSIDTYRRAVRAVKDIKEKIEDLKYKAYRKNIPKLSYECDVEESFY